MWLVFISHLDFLREGGREHESLPVSCLGHIILLYDTANLRFKSHVQHTVSLVQDQVSEYRRCISL